MNQWYQREQSRDVADRFGLNVKLICWLYNLESVSISSRQCDTLVGRQEQTWELIMVLHIVFLIEQKLQLLRREEVTDLPSLFVRKLGENAHANNILALKLILLVLQDYQSASEQNNQSRVTAGEPHTNVIYILRRQVVILSKQIKGEQ